MTIASSAMETDSPPEADEAPAGSARLRLRRRLWRLWRPADQPSWARPALAVLLAGTAVLYLWDLGASGWANSFYSAAVQAGSTNWQAFFFGSSDAGNSITVDKTPASLWLMALSVRIFGLSSWSILVPQALAGVAAVGLLYATVRRWFGPAAGLLAGTVMAITPVAVLMFRFNNPDALLVLLLVAGAYATTRAIEAASTRWLALVGALVGFAFLTKMLQALLVVPAFALAYLIAAPTRLVRRVWQLLLAGAAMVVAAGWWVAIVELLPASARPYIGGSQSNSILELTLGYNGLGRLTGDEVGSVGGGPAVMPGDAGAGTPVFGGVQGPAGGWGGPGLLRMFGTESGGQVSWLLPAALVLLVAVLVGTLRSARIDRTRAAIVLWGGWLLVTALTFSLMAGIFHAYYEVALAPAIGAVVGIGGAWLWQRRDIYSTAILAATVAGTAVWSYVLLGRTSDWHPWLRVTVLAAGIAAAAGLVLLRLPQAVTPGNDTPQAGDDTPPARLSTMVTLRRTGTVAVLAAAIGAVLGGPAAYAVSTAAVPHSGAIPTAGPAGAGGPGGVRVLGQPEVSGPLAGFQPGQAPGIRDGSGPGDAMAGGPGGGGLPFGAEPFVAGPGGAGPFVTGPGGAGPFVAGPGGAGPFVTGPGGAGGGLLDAATPPAEVVAALRADADRYTWAAATVGSNNAAGYQLSAGEPVMPIGGFNGSDPSPTLAQFQQYVADKRIHYFIGSAGVSFQAHGGSRASGDITGWVEATFTPTTIGGVTMYDLTQPAR